MIEVEEDPRRSTPCGGRTRQAMPRSVDKGCPEATSGFLLFVSNLSRQLPPAPPMRVFTSCRGQAPFFPIFVVRLPLLTNSSLPSEQSVFDHISLLRGVVRKKCKNVQEFCFAVATNECPKVPGSIENPMTMILHCPICRDYSCVGLAMLERYIIPAFRSLPRIQVHEHVKDRSNDQHPIFVTQT